MEYEELEKGRTGGICGDIMASNACLNLSASLESDMADNLFEVRLTVALHVLGNIVFEMNSSSLFSS